MKGTFTKQALQLWKAIPVHFRDKLLQNVWCGNCQKMTTIVDFVGRQQRSDLILTGSCAECGNKVVRLIEGDADLSADEKLKEKQAQKMEKLLDKFQHYLMHEKNLSKSTADNHCDRIGFFFFQYLQNYTDLYITDVNAEVIDEFLGNWYIRKVMNGGKSDVRPTLTAFKKFYQYLHEQKMIENERLHDILAVCKQPQRYTRRFDSYDALDFEGEAWEDQFHEWMYDWGERITIPANVNAEFERNARLEKLPSKKDLAKMPALKNFAIFLDYMVEKVGLKLTQTHAWIPRSHLLAMNKRMANPENLPAAVNQDKSWRLHAFYQLARRLEVFIVSAKNRVEITPRLEKFKNLPSAGQFAVMFDYVWNVIPWQDFKELYSGGRPDWVQNQRGNIAYRLGLCEPGKRYHYRVARVFRVHQPDENAFPGVKADFSFAGMTTQLLMDDVLESRIFPLLKDFGLVDFSYEKERDDWKIRHGWGIETYEVSKLGQKIFKSIGAKDE